MGYDDDIVFPGEDEIIFPGEERKEKQADKEEEDIESKSGINKEEQDVVFPGERESLKYGDGSKIEDLPASEKDKILNPKKNLIHRAFDVYRFLASFAAFNMSIGAFLMLCYFQHTKIEYTILAFLSAICVFIVISEVVDDSLNNTFCGCGGGGPLIYPNWIARGILYIFLGVIGISQWETAEDHEKMLVGYIYAVSWMMIIAGVVYTLSGIFCCQRLKEGVVSDYRKRYEHSLALKKNLKRSSI